MTINSPAPGRPYALFEAEQDQDILSVDADMVITHYKAHGAIVLRGFDLDIARFHAFTQRFCSASVFNESPGRRVLDAQRNIQSVDLGTAAFPLHPELAREPWRPDVCFFACLTPPNAGGMTTICDGVAIVEALPDGLRRALEHRRLLYIQKASPDELQYWLGTERPDAAQLTHPPSHCPYRFARMRGEILRIFSRPALHRPMFSNKLAFGNFLLFARYFNGRVNFPVLDDGQPVPQSWVNPIKAICDDLTVPITWQTGDIVMLDNSRFMHGRTEIIDASERSIASFFGYLSFAPIDPEEPENPIWRTTDFRPARRPSMPQRTHPAIDSPSR